VSPHALYLCPFRPKPPLASLGTKTSRSITAGETPSFPAVFQLAYFKARSPWWHCNNQKSKSLEILSGCIQLGFGCTPAYLFRLVFPPAKACKMNVCPFVQFHAWGKSLNTFYKHGIPHNTQRLLPFFLRLIIAIRPCCPLQF